MSSKLDFWFWKFFGFRIGIGSGGTGLWTRAWQLNPSLKQLSIFIDIPSYRSELQQHNFKSVHSVPFTVRSSSVVHPSSSRIDGIEHTLPPSKRRMFVIKFNLLWEEITFFDPLIMDVVALMHRGVVTVHFSVKSETIVSVSACDGGGGRGESLALVRILCPQALITFPPINWNNKKKERKML